MSELYDMDTSALARLDSLISFGTGIIDSATTHGGQLRTGFVTGEAYRTAVSYAIDIQAASKWRTSCLSFLEMQLGKENRYYESFEASIPKLQYEWVRKAVGVLEAVKDDHQPERMMLASKERKTLEEWAGSQHVSLGLVFTDIVKSTEIGKKRGDAKWVDDLFVHFSKGREIAARFDSYVVKVIGDSLMVAFRTASDAVSFSLEFEENTGLEHIAIRVGINSGDVEIRDNDIYGLNVNFTSRVQHALPGGGILVANSVQRDFNKRYGDDSGVRFIAREVDLKSFGRETVFFVATPVLMKVRQEKYRARKALLGTKAPSWLV